MTAVCAKCGLADSPIHRQGVLHRRGDEIRRLIDEGRTNQEIAQVVGISITRASQIVRHLRRPAKLGATKSEYRTKLSILLEHMVAGRWHQALKLAAKFPVLGAHKEAITRGANALNHPEFYRQLGRNPDELVAFGIRALKDRYRKKVSRP